MPARSPKPPSVLLGGALALTFAMSSAAFAGAGLQTGAPPSQAAASAVATPPGSPFSADALSALLPATVYFQGRSAPLQLRNAGGTTFTGGQIVWVSLVDSSGYSSAIQERYQFYLVTEGPLRVGTALLPAGAYGGGFLRDGFLLMDLGGHTVAQGPVETDATLRRPRPLQVVADRPDSVRLYLGRRWIVLKQDNIAKTKP